MLKIIKSLYNAKKKAIETPEGLRKRKMEIAEAAFGNSINRWIQNWTDYAYWECDKNSQKEK